jgi:hypothetical protein
MVGTVGDDEVRELPLFRKTGAMPEGCKPCNEGEPLAVHCFGAYGQSAVGQVFDEAEQALGTGTAFEAAAKYKLKVLVPPGEPNADP